MSVSPGQERQSKLGTYKSMGNRVSINSKLRVTLERVSRLVSLVSTLILAPPGSQALTVFLQTPVSITLTQSWVDASDLDAKLLEDTTT